MKITYGEARMIVEAKAIKAKMVSNITVLRDFCNLFSSKRKWYEDLCEYYNVTPQRAKVLGVRSEIPLKKFSSGRKIWVPGVHFANVTIIDTTVSIGSSKTCRLEVNIVNTPAEAHQYATGL
jgi:formylmethanofuran dehydrogenase subunit D